MFGTQKISQCRRILAVLIFTLLTASVSCTSDKGGSSAPPTIPSSAATIPPLSVSPSQSVPAPDPDLPDRIGLYIDDGGTRRLVEASHSAPWIAGQDIECYEAIASQEASLTGTGFAEIWNTCWSQFPNTKNIKLGYTVELLFKTGETRSFDVRSPEDAEENRDYVEIYLYDDVHQVPGEWYSHLEASDITEETIATSIKFTAGSKIEEIEKIHLSAYLYPADLPEQTLAEYGIDLLRA